MIVPFLSLIIICSSATVASAADDRCSGDLPCEPSADDSFFCDFQIGPAAGGYCVACEGRQTYFCSLDETGLSEAGRTDCEDKCSPKSCPEPCDDGYFCSLFNFQDGPCQLCETLIVHPEECRLFGFPDAGLEACAETCLPKACSKRRHCLSNDASIKYFCNIDHDYDYDEDEEYEPMGTCEPCKGLKSIDECGSRSNSELGLQECTEVCQDVIVMPCTTNDECSTKDRSFCNNDTDSTICQACPIGESNPGWHVNQCFNVSQMEMNGLVLADDASQSNCAISCHTECNDIMEGSLSIEGLIDYGKDSNRPMKGTPYASVSGPLVDCQFGGAGECPEDAPDDFVCLVSRGVRKFSDKALNCEESGGIATIMYNNEENGDIVEGTVGDAPLEIPITAISLQDGHYLMEHGLGLEAIVETKNMGEECDRGCSDSNPCPSSPGSWYCDYELVTHGYCQECGLDKDKQRDECFFSGLSLKGAQECSDTCESRFTSPSCKICGKGISGNSLQSAMEGEGEGTCSFCPDELKKSHFDREIPFIGRNATCYKLDQFFQNYPIAENDQNCQLALSFNYICDCEGPGYAGADSDAKRKALVWTPRISAIISFLSSTAIIVDVARDNKKRKSIYGQLMVAMSVFDLMGSTAYSLTTLPIPKEYYIEGSGGNEATCTAQGFFIQMGTISAFINVSLAAYYYCIIKLSWTDLRMERYRIRLFLCPITVGLAFAFAGIPFYDMLFLWCNNSAAWWPDVPIAVAILVTTCTMLSICLHVYKTEKKTRRYGRDSRSISSLVFWQSIWYLVSFYLTWMPYLALQYLWAAGKSYSSFGFVLFACTMVPLQGFWNCFVFFRLKAKKKVMQVVSNVSSNVSRVVLSRFSTRDHKGSVAEPSNIRQGSPVAMSHFSGRDTSVQPGISPGVFGSMGNGGGSDRDESNCPPKTPKEMQAQVANESIDAFAQEQSGSSGSDQDPAVDMGDETMRLENGWVGVFTSPITPQ